MITLLNITNPVFSACAEVVPSVRTGRDGLARILRVCGGSSNVSAVILSQLSYSPHTRR